MEIGIGEIRARRISRAVKVLGQPLDAPGLETYPDKTFIGRIERLRLSRLPFQFDGHKGAPADDCQLHRESISVL